MKSALIKFKHIKKTALFCFVITVITGCGGSDDSPNPSPPTAAALIFPEENSECTEGVVVNSTTSNVTFEWSQTEQTDTYTLSVRNLNTNTTETYSTTQPFREVSLTRNTPYSWFVTSVKTSTGESVSSNTWKLYNAGEGVKNYPPFPAGLLEPISGSTVYSSTNIDLLWSGADVDGDISGYDVYMGTDNPPATRIATNITDEQFTIAPQSANIYYWYVVTTDALGNSADSEIAQFRVE